MDNSFSFAAIRKKYPITRRDIFLNHAATVPLSTASIERIQHIAHDMQRPLSENFYLWLGILEETRRRLAELIGAHPTDIAFCQNTSTGLSLIANAVPFQPGDKVLVPRNEFPSNIYIWQSLRAKGIEFDFFDVEEGIPVTETLKKIPLRGVRLISLSAVSYYTGRLYELAEFCAFCRENGILSCIDAIQAIGATAFDVRTIQPDFVASGAQKWLLGSIGAGFVYARKEWLEQLQVPLVGWTSVKYPEDFSLKELDYAPEMARFEPGLPDILPIVALNQSLRDLSAIGWDTIYAAIHANTLYLTEALNRHNIRTLAQTDQTAGIVSFRLPETVDQDAFLGWLEKHRTHITQRADYVRVSPHFYNNEADLDIFLSSLEIKPHVSVCYTPHSATSSDRANPVLLTGATGTLGRAFAAALAKEGVALTLVGRDDASLTRLKQELENELSTDIQILTADFNDPASFDTLLETLRNSPTRYAALIHCAGFAESDEFIRLPADKLKDMLQVNCVATFQLMQLFVTHLRHADALGILNVVSATGRGGIPLLSGYAASEAARWSLSEILGRELAGHDDMTVLTYVAPPMHSRLQKRLGRVALRYFRPGSTFPYEQANRVAENALRQFRAKKSVYLHPRNRLTHWLNALSPGIISRRIRRLWKT